MKKVMFAAAVLAFTGITALNARVNTKPAVTVIQDTIKTDTIKTDTLQTPPSSDTSSTPQDTTTTDTTSAPQ